VTKNGKKRIHRIPWVKRTQKGKKNEESGVRPDRENDFMAAPTGKAKKGGKFMGKHGKYWG